MAGMDRVRLAGYLLLVAAVQFFPALSLAESLYPGYSVSSQPISDLGATCRTVSGTRTCTVEEPSSYIFEGSVILLGLLAIAAAILVYRSVRKVLGVALLLGGIGTVGLGLFPETTGAVHLLFSLIAFLFAGISAALSSRDARPPMSYVCAVLGIFSLVALVLYAGGSYLGLGQGGMERMIAYPALLWVACFGAYLAGRRETSVRIIAT